MGKGNLYIVGSDLFLLDKIIESAVLLCLNFKRTCVVSNSGFSLLGFLLGISLVLTQNKLLFYYKPNCCSFWIVLCTPHQILLRRYKPEEWDGQDMWHVWGRDAYEGKPLGRTRRRWEDSSKMGLLEVEWGARKGSIWLRMGTGGGLLWVRW